MSTNYRRLISWPIHAITVCAALMISADPTVAHHSTAHIDKESTIELRGTVVSYRYTNPHIHLAVEAVDETGQVRQLTFEMQSPQYLRRYGWDRQTWSPGDEIVAIGHPSKNPESSVAEGLRFTNATGVVFTTRAADDAFVEGILQLSENEAVRVPAERMEGIWELGHVDGIIGRPPELYERVAPEFHERVPNVHPSLWRFLPVINQTSVDALNSFDNRALGNPWCSPDPFYLSHYLEPVLMNLELNDDRLTFERPLDEFVVHIGGEHPPASETFDYGHAVGTWDGDVLRIDVANFAPNPWGLGRGAPSGSQKTVRHSISWADDRTMLYMSTTIFDPEYMTESLTIESRWVHSPQRELDEIEECSEDAANLYIREEF